MRVLETFKRISFCQNEFSVREKLSQKILSLVILLLCISPGLGNDKPPDCDANNSELYSSPYSYLKDRCNGDRECTLDLCSYLYPQVPSRHLVRYWDLLTDGLDENRFRSKRGFLNKNVAYLLLKLHPFLNQTSQFGFLTSGRFRRITGSFGTEFLGKRSNNRGTPSRYSGGRNQNSPKPKTTSSPQFYSLPLDKFAKSKILKRGENLAQEPADSDSREKRLSVRGNGKVVLGSEFLGKRGYFDRDRMRRLTGNEFLGKRNGNSFDGSELLGKRVLVSRGGGEFSENRIL